MSELGWTLNKVAHSTSGEMYEALNKHEQQHLKSTLPLFPPTPVCMKSMVKGYQPPSVTNGPMTADVQDSQYVVITCLKTRIDKQNTILNNQNLSAMDRDYVIQRLQRDQDMLQKMRADYRNSLVRQKESKQLLYDGYQDIYETSRKMNDQWTEQDQDTISGLKQDLETLNHQIERI
jgi:hypothetical protein